MSNWNSIVTSIGTGVGGGGGTPFAFSEQGQRVTRLVVHHNDKGIKAVRVKLSSGREKTFGNPGETPSKQLDFDPGERIKTLKLWGNGDGWNTGRTGRIYLVTTKGKTLDVGTGGGAEHSFDVKSGMVVGVVGRSGSDIDWIGFQVLNDIRSSVLTDVVYPTLGEIEVELEPFEVSREAYENASSAEQEFTLSGEISTTIAREWSLSIATELSLSVSVKAGVPELVETETEMTWSIGVERSFTRSHEVTETESYSFTVKVPPERRVAATATMYRTSIDIPYRGKLVFELLSGDEVSFPVEGTYTGVLFRRAGVMVEEAELSHPIAPTPQPAP